MNWKTTLLGVFTILAAVADAGKEFLSNGTLGDIGLLFAAVTAGVGLIVAKDSNASDDRQLSGSSTPESTKDRNG
jgi:hypothetical protein